MQKPIHIQLEERRKSLGMSQHQLAEAARIHRSMVQRALGGSPVTTDTLKALCKAMRLDVALLERGS